MHFIFYKEILMYAYALVSEQQHKIAIKIFEGFQAFGCSLIGQPHEETFQMLHVNHGMTAAVGADSRCNLLLDPHVASIYGFRARPVLV